MNIMKKYQNNWMRMDRLFLELEFNVSVEIPIILTTVWINLNHNP